MTSDLRCLVSDFSISVFQPVSICFEPSPGSLSALILNFRMSAFQFSAFDFKFHRAACQRFQPVSIIRANSRNSRRKFPWPVKWRFHISPGSMSAFQLFSF